VGPEASAAGGAKSEPLNRGRSTRLRLLSATLVWVLTATVLASPSMAAAPYRAFSTSSYWNQPLPANAPIDTNSVRILEFLKKDSTTNYIRFSGVGSSGNWGNPIYWSSPTDGTYAVRNSCGHKMPPEFQSVRVPAGAKGDPTSDGAMTVYDVDKGIVYAFRHASFSSNTWSSCGGTAYYLNSNGLDGKLAESDEIRNFGHRGVPPSTYAVRYDEVTSGAIDHVLKIAVHHTADEYVFHMTGHESGSTDPYAPPEGTRIRIKPSVDISSLGLNPGARVVATALQKYGAVIGDQSGGQINLKVENTVAEGRGQLWAGVLDAGSLSSISLDMYEVIQLGYGSGPTPPLPSTPPNAPSGLTAAAVSDKQINLAWADGSSNEDGFRIERSSDGLTFAQIATVGPNATAYNDTALAPDATYHYRVRAYNANGTSAYSNTASAKTHALPPPDAAPGALTLYLHNQASPPAGDTTAQKNMPMNAAQPTATTLRKYSTNLYTSYPGRLVEKKNTTSAQSSTKYMMNWTYQLSTNTTFSGSAELRLWVALKDLKCDKTPSFKAYLKEKTSATTDTGIEFASASATSPPVGGEPCGFRLVTITLPVNRTVAAGKWIELKVTVNESTGDSALFAYDTTGYNSRLNLP
jgi:hypothetical protein